MLASLPEIDNPGLVLPGLGPRACGIVDLDTLWEECNSAEASSQLNYAAAAAAAAPDQNGTWASVVPREGSSDQRMQARFNGYLVEGLVAANSGGIRRVPCTAASSVGPIHDTRVMAHESVSVAVAHPSAVMSSFASSSAAHAYGHTRPDTSEYLSAMLPF